MGLTIKEIMESIINSKLNEDVNVVAESTEDLQEALITFRGKAYPKFGTVVIMAGGAGSGKGFVLEKLVGVEGKV